MLARAAPGVIGGLIIIETLRAQGVLIEEGAGAARALWFSLLAYLLGQRVHVEPVYRPPARVAVW